MLLELLYYLVALEQPTRFRSGRVRQYWAIADFMTKELRHISEPLELALKRLIQDILSCLLILHLVVSQPQALVYWSILSDKRRWVISVWPVTELFWKAM